MRLSVISSAIIATLVGLAGTLAIVIAAAEALHASPPQTASWVTALSIAMGVASGYLSWRHRIPIIIAWSTPGAAVIAASAGNVSLEAAVGAFVLAGALLLLTALIKPLGRVIERIPMPVAAAMLGGVLVRFVVGVFESVPTAPALVLPLIALFLAMRLLAPSAAMLVVITAGAVLAAWLGLSKPFPDLGLSTLEPVLPSFEPAVQIGLGVPLYLVTMASQNLPGAAVLRAAGFPVPMRSILAVTGLTSVVIAFVGAHTVNLAAITAAICTGPEAHPDPKKRWLTGLAYCFTYLVPATFGATLVGIFTALPVALIKTIAGLGLIGALTGALSSALTEERHRFAAVLTFVVTASGLTLVGIGSAFWGLVAGLAATSLESGALRLRTRG
jgi:benzoate membrane transport protein